MAMQASGAISLSQIQTEFGGTNPIGLNEYYRGGSYVGGGAPNVPTSGAISLSQFYGSSKNFVLNYTVSSPTANLNVRNLLISYGWDTVVPAILTLTNNSIIYESSYGTTALNCASLSAGSVVNLTNNGYITGVGGAGGAGMYASGSYGSAGSPGGYAVYTPGTNLHIWNNAYIWGGGGGGGGGQSGSIRIWTCTYAISGGMQDYYDQPTGGNGGGGGCGYVGGAGGAAGYDDYYAGAYSGSAGAAGYWAAGGAGAGNGGGPGQAGGAGYFGGGAAGFYIYSNSNVTWHTVGDCRGNVY